MAVLDGRRGSPGAARTAAAGGRGGGAEYGTDSDGLARSAMEETSPPPRVLAISALALSVATVAGLVWPESVDVYSGFVWLLPLIPLFLFAYYRGWRGVTAVLGVTMVAFTGVEVVVEPLLGRNLDWRLFGAVSVVLTAVTLGAGWLSDRLHALRLDAYRMAFEDTLTGLPSRRALEFFLEKQFAEAERGYPFSVALFDLDDFKEYNDRHGHGAGDDFLRRVARVLAENSRRMNVVGRYGGEEFLAVLPGERPTGAEPFAGRIVRAVEEAEPAVGEGCTISAGVAGYAEELTTYEEVVDRADEALYRAKEHGGNQVQVHGPGADEPG